MADSAPKSTNTKPTGARKPNPAKRKGGFIANITPMSCATAGVGLILGILVGKFALGPTIGNVTQTKSTEVTSDQLGEVVASYIYDGKTVSVSLQELGDSGNLAVNEDGSYAMPTPETIISYARDQILFDEIDKQNIEINDDDIKEYLNGALSEDISTIADYAAAAGVSEDEAKVLVERAVRENKLFEQIAGKLPDLPDYPAEPAEDADADAATKEYADYIIKIAGDDWKDGAWADADDESLNDDQKFSVALDKFDGQTATYADAQSAYMVLYNRYQAKATEANEKWAAWRNETLKNCNITVATLIQ